MVVDAKRVAAYAKVCGFGKAHGVPMLFPHMDAFPLAMMLFGSRRFPFPAMGLVHLANSAKLLQRIHVDDVLRIEMRTGELIAHDKGQAFTLHARALRDGEVVWESTWTLLRLGVRQPKGPPYTSQLIDERPLSHQADFFAGASIGRSYGRVSGDSVVDSTDSRTRLKSRLCFITAPAATSPRRWPCRLKRSIRPWKVAVSISWLETLE